MDKMVSNPPDSLQSQKISRKKSANNICTSEDSDSEQEEIPIKKPKIENNGKKL